MPSPNPLCFVLMPFGTKKDPATGQSIDFDAIYDNAIRPGVEASGMDPIRADEERTGGIIHKAMFERLMLCEYAVADLTTANANVFYELGVRHAVRPATTLAIFASQQRLPFDVEFLRALPYSLGEGNRFGSDEASSLKQSLTQRLEDLKTLQVEDVATDSPVFQLLEEYSAPDIARLKTDVFRDRTRYAADVKNELARARSEKSGDRLREIQSGLDSIEHVEFGVLVDLFLSYRAVQDWDAMLALYEAMPVALQRTILVREQLGFAYNRLKRRDDAEQVLEGVLKDVGANSETCGLIGRIFKDRWVEAEKEGKTFEARGYLKRAIDMYQKGFEADSRDAYPGINAATLLDIQGDAESLAMKDRLVPVVRYAVERRLASSKPDYWDHATLVELSVLGNDPDATRDALADALIEVRETWEPQTTANNLKLIQKARTERGASTDWLDEVIEALESAGN